VAFEEAAALHGALRPDLYEAFLSAHAPGRRRTHGVYDTPLALVEAQVRLVSEVLCRLGARTASAIGGSSRSIQQLEAARTRWQSCVRTTLRGCCSSKRWRGRPSWREAQASTLCSGRAAGDESADSPILVCLGNPPYRRRRRDVRSSQRVAALVSPSNACTPRTCTTITWRLAMGAGACGGSPRGSGDCELRDGGVLFARSRVRRVARRAAATIRRALDCRP